MKKYILIYIVINWVCLNTQAQDTDKNYIKVYKPNIKISNEASLPASSKENCQKTIEYFDGLGLPDQVIQVEASPNGYDMIQPIAYDSFGREVNKYLPYALTTSNNGEYITNELDASKWTNHYNLIESAYAYSKSVFDNSPLNRVMKQGAPGSVWQPGSNHTVRVEYTSNLAGEVRRFVVRNDKLDFDGDYSSGELYKVISRDENWTSGNLHTSEEFKNKQDQVVLKRSYVKKDGAIEKVDTYYVYDYFGLLRFVLPPLAVEKFNEGDSGLTYNSSVVVIDDRDLSMNEYDPDVDKFIVVDGGSVSLKDGFSFTATTGTSLVVTASESGPSEFKDCYYAYCYDNNKRMVEKKLPGVAPVYMVYDSRDRLVLTQDGNQRDKNQWMYTLYDAFNRSIETGYYIETQKTHSDLQNIVGVSKNYNITGGIALTRMHYDNYDASSSWGFNFSKPSGFSANYQAECSNGLMTARETKSLENDVWIKEVFYYDKFGKLLQTYKQNHLGGYDKITNKYDFAGNVKLTQQSHKKLNNLATVVIEKEFVHDHQNRLTKVYHSIGNQTPVLLVENKYNELGQLEEKNLHNGVQSVDYRYNIRGWLTSINNSNLSNDGTLNNDSNDLFGMEIGYNSSVSGFSGGSSQEQYNGNISWMSWKKADSGTRKAYAFTYDALSRLTKTDLLKNNPNSNINENTPLYGFVNYSYDLNGNITSLNRKKNDMDEFIDRLTYKYQGNQLYNVHESNTNLFKDNGFKQLATGSGQEYIFDANGNLIHDDNRGHDIEYNLLNLPNRINNTTLAFHYNASGEKYGKVYTNGSNVVNTNYIGNFVYKDGSLSYIITSEGRIVKPGSTYEYEYNLKDHLGNTRVSFKGNGSTAVALQYKDYYPFGMAFSGSLNNDNKYLYNGKELQDDVINGDNLDWLDFHARFYDAAIVRTTTQDPMAESFYGESPYSFMGNNPILNTDPTGMFYTRYEDENKNLLLETNDGSDAVVTVTDDKRAGFDAAVKGTKNTDDVAWNNTMKKYALGFELSGAQESLLSMMNSNWSKRNAISYWQNPTAGNSAAFAFSEALSQWTNPELVVAGLSAGVAGYSATLRSTPSSASLRNGHLAGKVHPKTGVPFTRKGFPNFKNHLYKRGANDVRISPTGNRLHDFSAANKAAGYKSTPKGYTWHHHQTRGRMQLVESNIHRQTGHTGGFSLWQ
nr:DUF6443 domain-containing protein [uncultured Marinifilum sp.]